MRLKSVSLALLPLAVASASARAVATYALVPTADTFVSAAQPEGSFGAAGALAVSSASLPNGQFRTLIRFDTADAVASFNSTFGVNNWALVSASLSLTSASPNNPKFNSPNAPGLFSVSWLANDAWVEGAGSPNAPGTDGVSFNSLSFVTSPADQFLGNFAFPGGTAGANAYSLLLNSSFLSDLTAGNDVTLLLSPADSGVTFVVNSSNFGTPSARPSLTLTATSLPEPSLLIAVLVFLPLVGRPCRGTGVSQV